MPPGHVRNLEDYWLWLDQLFEASGGLLEHTVLLVEPLYALREDEFDRIIIPPQRLALWNDTVLHFALTVDDNLTAIKYSFHYMRLDGTLLWRKDNVHRHKNHPDLAHVHLDPEDGKFAEPYDEIDPDEAMDEVNQYLVDGILPESRGG